MQRPAREVSTFKLGRSSVLATAGAPTPVPRSSVLVSDGNKKHVLIPSSVDDVERKASNQSFAKSSSQWRARTGRGVNALRRLLDRRQKAYPKPLKARFIEIDGRIEFRPS